MCVCVYIYISWFWMVIGKCHTFHLFVSPIVPSLLSLSKSMPWMIPKDFSWGHWFHIKTREMVDFELINICVFSTDFCRYPMFFFGCFFGYSLGMATEQSWGIAMYGRYQWNHTWLVKTGEPLPCEA